MKRKTKITVAPDSILITGKKDVLYTQLDLDIGENAFENLVGYGKQLATEQDYFEIAFYKLLKDYVEKNKD